MTIIDESSRELPLRNRLAPLQVTVGNKGYAKRIRLVKIGEGMDNFAYYLEGIPALGSREYPAPAQQH